MESLNIKFDLTSPNLSQFSESFTKPTSKIKFSSRISCSCSCYRNTRNGLNKVSQAINARKEFNEQYNNGGFIESKGNILKWVGRGVIGFAAAISLCCDSPASAESLTFAFPVSHFREVNTVQRTLVEAWSLIRETFVDPTFNHQDWDLKLQETMREMFPLRSEDAAYNKLKGMLSSLNDPFTRIISPKEYQTFRIGTDGNLQGVGLFINVEPKSGHLVVTSCVENGPAARAGIHEGDELVEINGEKLEGLGSEAAAQKLRGRAGTIVTVKIHPGSDSRASGFREVELPREVIQLSPVSSAIIPHRAPDGHLSKTGYVKLSAFSQSAAIDMENTISEMESEGVQSYILDLRNNPVSMMPIVSCHKALLTCIIVFSDVLKLFNVVWDNECLQGGLVKAGLDVAQIWLEGNETLVNTIDRSGTLLPINISNGHALTHNPLAVLVNEGSASASEILAGALHDNGRAILIGHRTFGKGKIQSVTELHDGSALFITVAKYLSPALHDIDQVGIAPDVQCSTEMLNTIKDSFKDKANGSSLEADSCVIIAEHQLDIRKSYGSAS